MVKGVSQARQKSLDNITKEWKRAKAKVYRAKAKGVELDFPFSDTNLRELKKAHTNTLKSVTKTLSNWSKRGSQQSSIVKVNSKGLYIPKEMLNELNSVEQQMAILKRKELDKQKKMPIISNGKKISTVYEQNRMKAPNSPFSRFLDNYSLERATKQAEVQHAIDIRKKRLDDGWEDKRRVLMKENFIHSLRERYGDSADDVIKELEKATPQQFYYLYQRFTDVMDFVYIPSDEEAQSEYDYEVLENMRDLLAQNDLYDEMIE